MVVGILIGALVGVTVGVIVMALVNAGARADECAECRERQARYMACLRALLESKEGGHR